MEDLMKTSLDRVEELFDGPYDGLRIKVAGRSATYTVVNGENVSYRTTIYVRRDDGKLYWEKSNWVIPNP